MTFGMFVEAHRELACTANISALHEQILNIMNNAKGTNPNSNMGKCSKFYHVQILIGPLSATMVRRMIIVSVYKLVSTHLSATHYLVLHNNNNRWAVRAGRKSMKI